MAYVLGFFAADGYITVNKRGGQFWCIQITDKALLEKIKKVVRSEHKISKRDGLGNENTVYRLQIGSIEMCDDLRNLGFDERKTKRMMMPNIPKKYFSSFVRGYFDGDGNVWSGFIHKDRKVPNLTLRIMFTSCSYEFLQHLHAKIGSLGIEGGSVYTAKGNFSRLQFSAQSALKLYGFMYNQCGSLRKNGLFLNRKKKVFEKYSALMKLRS